MIPARFPQARPAGSRRPAVTPHVSRRREQSLDPPLPRARRLGACSGRGEARRARVGELSPWPTPSPAFWPYFPNRPVPPLSCQAKYFGLAGGAERTGRSQQANPCGLGAGRAGAGRGPCTRPGDSAACAGQRGLGGRARPRGPGETLPRAPGPLRPSSAPRAPQASLCPWGRLHFAPHPV